ncbi:MAG: SRPBCC domain-containing protein [Ferruginibacter sp.]
MPNIHHALLVGVSPEKVYSAIASQEGISDWWTPGTKGTMELNSVVRFHFGTSYFKEMKITGLQLFRLVEWNCITGAPEWIGTNISFQLLPWDKETLLTTYPEMQGQAEQQSNDNGTLLIFHHDDWKAYTLMFAECSHTWGQFLRSLKLLCETGQGRPWPNQHQAG